MGGISMLLYGLIASSGLRTIVEKMLMEIMFELPDIQGKKEFVVTKDIVLKKQNNDIAKLIEVKE